MAIKESKELPPVVKGQTSRRHAVPKRQSGQIPFTLASNTIARLPAC